MARYIKPRGYQSRGIPMTKYIYRIGESDDPEVVGGKGSSLSIMQRMGLPVPDGFTVSAQAYRDIASGKLSVESLNRRVMMAVKKVFPNFGSGTMLSVRSGAKFSMPGMMDTILNVGVTSDLDPVLAINHYRSLALALGVDRQVVDDAIDSRLVTYGKWFVSSLSDYEVAGLRDRLQYMCKGYASGMRVSWDGKGILKLAVSLVLKSWMSDRAVLYRQTHGIPDDIGTAVTVQRMVYGTHGGSGVYLTRNPDTGGSDGLIDWVKGGQGDVVVDGSSLVSHGDDLAAAFPDLYRDLMDIGASLERAYGDAMDIEFTIDEGKLYILQCRRMKRTQGAAVRLAVELYDQGIMSLADVRKVALPDSSGVTTRVRPGQDDLIIGRADPVVGRLFTGIVRMSMSNHDISSEEILFRYTTSPDDLEFMIRSGCVLTVKGGPTCHAALVAREIDKPCYVGFESEQDHIGLFAGDQTVVTIDPDGTVYRGYPILESHTITDGWSDRLRTIQKWG